MSRLRLCLAAISTMAFIVLGSTVPAWAHVTVNPREASKGGYAKLTFRVPNERDATGTTQLEITFPPEYPIRSVSIKPQPGWTYAVEKVQLAAPVEGEGDAATDAVSKITWSGGLIKPGEFGEFDVSVGPLPDTVDQLVFKAVQTYEGGEVVRWIEEAVEGAEEPERPAPVLKLTTAADDQEPATDSTSDVAAPSASDTATKDDVDGAKGLATAGLVAGALGLVAGIAAVVRSRPRKSAP